MEKMNATTISLGKTKIDQTKRISLIKAVSDIFDAIPGDEIEYYLEKLKYEVWDGVSTHPETIEEIHVCIKKIVVPFKGWNFEEKEIKERMEKAGRPWSIQDESKNNLQKDKEKAKEEYEQYKAERKKNIKQ